MVGSGALNSPSLHPRRLRAWPLTPGEAFSAPNPKLDLKGLLLRGGERGGRDIGEGKWEGGRRRGMGRGKEGYPVLFDKCDIDRHHNHVRRRILALLQ